MFPRLFDITVALLDKDSTPETDHIVIILTNKTENHGYPVHDRIKKLKI